MIGKVTVINPASGAGEVIHYNEPIGLEDLQKHVGGLIELIPGFKVYNGETCVALCHEEGKLIGLPYNREASVAWYTSLGHNVADRLVGNIVVIQGDDEFMEEV